MTFVLGLVLAQAFPSGPWTERTPEQAGLSRPELGALRDLAGGEGCVVRGGALAFQWGDPSRSSGAGSAAEPLLSTLLLRAVEEGKLDNLNARVSEVEPRLTGKDAEITWRQLACRLSGFGREDLPGAAYGPSDAALSLFQEALMGKVFRDAGPRVLKERLADVLGFQDPCTIGDPGTPGRSGRLAISVRDAARFGLLVLRGGRWGERQLIPPSLIYLSISSPVPASTPRGGAGGGASPPGPPPPGPGYYSFGWWLNSTDAQGRQLFVDGPGDLVAALGAGGSRGLFVFPSLDLVVSLANAGFQDLDRSPGASDAKLNLAVRRMVASVVRTQ